MSLKECHPCGASYRFSPYYAARKRVGTQTPALRAADYITSHSKPWGMPAYVNAD